MAENSESFDVDPGHDHRQQGKKKGGVGVDDEVAEGHEQQPRGEAEHRLPSLTRPTQNSNHPPSTTRTWPVTNAAYGDASHVTAQPSSCG